MLWKGECLIGQDGPATGDPVTRRRPPVEGGRVPRREHPANRLVSNMAEYIYSMVRARKAVGDKLILDDVTMSFLPGAKIGVVGPNGAGKSTILKIMAGLDTPSNGEAKLTPGYTVGILMQEPELDETKTVLENVQEGVGPIKGKVDRFNEISAAMAEPDADFDALLAEMGTLQEEIDARRRLGPRLPARAGDGCPAHPAAETVRSRTSPVVRSAASRSASCCCRSPTCCCSTSPPTTSTPRACSGSSSTSPSTPAPCSPSPTTGTSSTTSPSGSPRSTAATSTPTRATTRPTSRRSRSACRCRARRTPKLAKRLAERARVGAQQRQGPPGQVEGASRPLRGDGDRGGADPQARLRGDRRSPPGPRLGSAGHRRARSSQKGFDERVLIDDLSFTLPRNGIVGVIGPNGVGKTTLFKTIVGLEPLDGGDLKIGETVDISYVDQSRGGIDPNKNLWEVVSDGQDYIQVGKTEIPSRAYVSQFGFKGPDQQKKAGVLSGGERNRLNLALTLKQGGNLLLLDEPTNDLDVETLGSLENALLEFPGCAVVITHDRWFLDRIATHILAYEGTEEDPGNWYWFEGNFEAYEENKIERLGAGRREAAPLDVPQAHARLTPCGMPSVPASTSRSTCAGATSTRTTTSTTRRCCGCSRRRACARSGAPTRAPRRAVDRRARVGPRERTRSR